MNSVLKGEKRNNWWKLVSFGWVYITKRDAFYWSISFLFELKNVKMSDEVDALL
jgi:hypothetical protein